VSEETREGESESARSITERRERVVGDEGQKIELRTEREEVVQRSKSQDPAGEGEDRGEKEG